MHKIGLAPCSFSSWGSFIRTCLAFIRSCLFRSMLALHLPLPLLRSFHRICCSALFFKHLASSTFPHLLFFFLPHLISPFPCLLAYDYVPRPRHNIISHSPLFLSHTPPLARPAIPFRGLPSLFSTVFLDFMGPPPESVLSFVRIAVIWAHGTSFKTIHSPARDKTKENRAIEVREMEVKERKKTVKQRIEKRARHNSKQARLSFQNEGEKLQGRHA